MRYEVVYMGKARHQELPYFPGQVNIFKMAEGQVKYQSVPALHSR